MQYKTMTLYRSGPVRLRKFAIDTTLTYEFGDILYYDSSAAKVKPATSYTWDTNIATTQGTFTNVFCGICWELHDPAAFGATYHTTISVDVSTESIYEYPMTSGTLTAVNLFGIGDAGSGTALVDQLLVITATAANAIAVTADNNKLGTATTCRVTFNPAYVTNTTNAAAQH